LGQVGPDAAQEVIEETTAQATRDQHLDTAFCHPGERLRSLQIDHQFEPRRLLDGNVAELRAIEYFVSEKPACTARLR